MVSLVRAGFTEGLKNDSETQTSRRSSWNLEKFLAQFWLLENELEMCFTLCVYDWEKRESQQLKTLPTSKMGISTRFDITLKVTPKVEVKKRSNFKSNSRTHYNSNSFWI